MNASTSPPSLYVVPRQCKDTLAPVRIRVAGDFAELRDWASAMDVPITVAEEGWHSLTYQAIADVDGARVCCRFRDRLPHGVALRRLARTYIVGMVHPADSGECYHARQVTTPCPRRPHRRRVGRDPTPNEVRGQRRHRAHPPRGARRGLAPLRKPPRGHPTQPAPACGSGRAGPIPLCAACPAS